MGGLQLAVVMDLAAVALMRRLLGDASQASPMRSQLTDH